MFLDIVIRTLICGIWCRITQKTVQIFYGVPIDLGHGGTWYWAEDTSIVWNSAPHKKLMIAAGIPLLTAVCIGFPAFLLLQLLGIKKELVSDPQMHHYEYFYCGYRAQFHHWAVFVQGRKAIIAVISVLSSMLSVEFKGNLSLFTLLLAFGLQIFCNPWEDMRLNKMEEASLMTSCFACLIQGAAQSPKWNRTERQSLLVMSNMVVVGYVLYMSYELLKAYETSIREWVILRKGYEEHNGGLVSITVEVVDIAFYSTLSLIKELMSPGKLLKRGFTGWGVNGGNRPPRVDPHDDIEIPLVQFYHQAD